MFILIFPVYKASMIAMISARPQKVTLYLSVSLRGRDVTRDRRVRSVHRTLQPSPHTDCKLLHLVSY